MLAHLEALEASLAPLGYPTFRIFAPDNALSNLPYIVLEAPAWRGHDEFPLCDESDALNTDVRVKAVGANADAVLRVLTRVRELWSPDLQWTPVAVTGRLAEIRYRRSEFVYVDRDVTMPDTNRHPGVGVDTYHLDSQPA